MKKKSKTKHKKRIGFLPKFEIREKLSRLKKEIVEYFLSFDFIHWFAYKGKSRKEFKVVAHKNASESANALIEGLGGIKNLVKVKQTLNSLEVFFKSKYLIRKEIIQNCGGMGVTISDKTVFAAFGKEETKRVVKNLKMQMADAKRKYIEADIE